MARKVARITQSVVLVVLFLTLPVLLVPTFIVFGLFRQLLRLLLKLIYRSQFYGLLERSDVVWSNESLSKGMINFIVVVDYQEDLNSFIESVAKAVDAKFFRRQSKLTCIRKKCLGYSFLLKNSYSVEECIQIIPVNSTLDRAYLQQFISSNFDKDLPKNNSSLWEILIFDKRVNWSQDKNQFATLFRVHHSFGDGFALFDVFSSCFSNDASKIKSINLRRTPERFTSWYSCVWSLFIGFPLVTSQLLLRPVDRNKLHGKHLIGRKFVVWAVEDEEKLVPLVKMIKNRTGGTRFSDVVLAAVAASLEEYYLQSEECVPDFLTCAIPVIFGRDQNCERFGPRNNFSLAMLNLPVKSFGLISEILDDIKKETNRLRIMPDYLVYYWLLNLVAPLLPETVLRPMIYSRHSTLSISILPGTDRMRVFKDQSVQDVVFWIPHQGSTGVGLSVLTYDNRFQIGLSIDKALISDEKKAQMIVDGIFRHILLLHQAVFGNLINV